MYTIRAVSGVILAPLLPGLLFGIFGQFGDGSVGLWWCLKFSAEAGYPVAIVLGVPLYFLYRKYNITGIIVYIVTGLVLGLVPYLAAVLPSIIVAFVAPQYDSSAWYAAKGVLLYLPVSALCGGIASAFFWLVARPDRVPDRQLNGV